ncbi:MAG: metal-dependent transcriptional regulator [Saprospiraceae bacterium]|nr:metal-dependent transcriptional regulator [Saprospiraceae bacterium]MCB0572977.1 metal-dependent transcriptional regulator [Saprospiraceae bacterium]MCB9306712.1 metal-dependent transcriptional regulator [Lewinellaceae bacterium]MCB9353061.1 metal-dependent transcriptional regulator [Lewinellaceae bacterium]
MTITQAEENYLKAIFKISEKSDKPALTNAISAVMQTTAASVTDMLKRLAEKDLISYEKYKGVQLTEEGNRLATALIRKHRLWEVFLTEKLGFAWDEVHELAEQLEHVQGNDLVGRLDAFLGHPKFDPHGDPIPDADGRWAYRKQSPLATLQAGDHGVVTGVEDHSSAFLQYLDQLGLGLGAGIELIERFPYDQSVRIRTSDNREMVLSEKVSQNLYIKTG